MKIKGQIRFLCVIVTLFGFLSAAAGFALLAVYPVPFWARFACGCAFTISAVLSLQAAILLHKRA